MGAAPRDREAAVGQAGRHHGLAHRHARQFKCERRQLKFQHTRLGWIARSFKTTRKYLDRDTKVE
jgi:hypothetical protein